MDRTEIAQIGKYKILGQIGEGAMGVVYRALDPVLNRAVAIKVMSDSLARDADLRGRFLREAQSAGSLQHPNVITIYDFGEVDGHPFIAMEFVEGSDLNELLANKSPMTLVEKLDVLIDVLNGLSYAHKRGIVHRDIKPANIRIDEDGRARVMDFGIAHLSSSSMTRTGVMVGTPAYMCPEQITGGEITPASDLFAVGAVMYELLTGVQAFRGESLQTVMYKIVSAPTPDLKLFGAGLSPDRIAVVTKALNTIVVKALEKDVPHRYQSALEMSTDLSDVRTRLIDVNDPIRTTSLRATVAKAMANTEEMKLRKRRNRFVGAGAGAVLVVALGWTAFSWSRRRAEPAAAIPDLPPTIATQPAAQPENPVATVKTQTPTPPPAVVAPVASAPAKSATTTTTPTTRELAVFRSLQSTALEARRRAADAGATAEALSAGDGHNKLATALALQGKTIDAGDHLNQATIQWSAAERNAKAASTALAQASRANPVEAPKPQAPPPTAAVSSVQQAAIPQTPAPPVSNPAADIAAAVSAYARALESKDVGLVRHAYPGITSAQARGWEQFFATLRTIKVSLAINGLEVNGTTADARLVGTYDYVTEAGKVTQQAVSFQAAFRREGGAWQLASVH